MIRGNPGGWIFKTRFFLFPARGRHHVTRRLSYELGLCDARAGLFPGDSKLCLPQPPSPAACTGAPQHRRHGVLAVWSLAARARPRPATGDRRPPVRDLHSHPLAHLPRVQVLAGRAQLPEEAVDRGMPVVRCWAPAAGLGRGNAGTYIYVTSLRSAHPDPCLPEGLLKDRRRVLSLHLSIYSRHCVENLWRVAC